MHLSIICNTYSDMINLEELQKMPLPKLLMYREALEALVGKYEQDVIPLYGMASQFDKQTPQQKEGNQKLNRIKGYLNIIYQAIEYIAFKELDEWKSGIEPTVDNKKELLVENNDKKVKRNAKKSNKKN